MSAIAGNLEGVNDRIAAAATRAGRHPEEITLVAVTKKQGVSAILEAQVAGVTEIGENYVQEAAEKRFRLSGGRWHLLGHLQSNKAKQAVSLFDLIQSVDSVKLAQALGKHALAAGRVQDLLLQVHLGDEETKTGLPLEQVLDAAGEVAAVPGVALGGLMGIAPFDGDPRPHFQTLHRLFETLPTSSRHILSMGMSGDFETAIEEGATMVRVGTAIFGART